MISSCEDFFKKANKARKVTHALDILEKRNCIPICPLCDSAMSISGSTSGSIRIIEPCSHTYCSKCLNFDSKKCQKCSVSIENIILI